MAAEARAQSFNPQAAAADLRAAQQASRTSRASTIPRNISLGELPAAQVPANDFGAQERAYRIRQATTADVLPAERGESPELSSFFDQLQELRQSSFGRSVSELGPVRGVRQELADRAAAYAAQQAKEKFQRTLARLAAQGVDDVGGGIAEMAEAGIGETDAGAFSFLDIFYKFARVAMTIFYREDQNAGASVSENVQYTAKKTLAILIPPYKMPWSGASIFDLLDDVDGIIELFIPGLIIAILGFFVLFLIILAGGAAYLGSWLDWFPHF